VMLLMRDRLDALEQARLGLLEGEAMNSDACQSVRSRSARAGALAFNRNLRACHGGRRWARLLTMCSTKTAEQDPPP
jgi:hypothetical protein